MQVNELKKMRDEQNVKQIQLENMIKRMRDTVDENLIGKSFVIYHLILHLL